MTQLIPTTPNHELGSLAGCLFEQHYALGPAATDEEWALHWATLAALEQRVTWWVGDCLIAGEERFPDRYSQMCEATALKGQTLYNAAWVCRRFKPERRRPELSFSHHRSLAGIESDKQQDMWLDRCIAEGWSVAQLEAHRNGNALVDPPAVPPPPPVDPGIKPVVSAIQATFIKRPTESGEFEVLRPWGVVRVQVLLQGDAADDVDEADFEVVESS